MAAMCGFARLILIITCAAATTMAMTTIITRAAAKSPRSPDLLLVYIASNIFGFCVLYMAIHMKEA